MPKIPKILLSLELDGDEDLYYSRVLDLGFIPQKDMLLELMVGTEVEEILVTKACYQEQKSRIVLEAEFEYPLNGTKIKDLQHRFESDKNWKHEVL